MLTGCVDSSFIPGVNAPITLDALLSAIEPVLGQSGRIVTAVRINGVEDPAFREPDTLGRNLSNGDTIDVSSTPYGTMASYALEDALRFLPALSDSARSVASDLRGTDRDAGRRAVGELAENLALLVALVHTADMWARQAGLAATGWLGQDVDAVDEAAGRLERAAGASEWDVAASALDADLTQALDAWHTRLVAGHAALEALNGAATA